MHNLSDRFVVDLKTATAHQQDEQKRKFDVNYAALERQHKPREEYHDKKPINSMNDLLKGIRV